MVKFGISFLPDSSANTKSASNYFKDAIELCVLADQADMSLVKMTEHYLHSYGGYCPSPLIFLSAVAAKTKQIRLMTGCILPVFHHPIQIAAEVAMLDVISQGRMEVGFARAYLPYEFDAFQIDMDTSRDRYVKTILTTIKLWKEKNVSVESPYFSFQNINNMPEPFQQPHPRVWCAAVNSRQSFAWIGEQGFNLLVSPSTESMERLKEGLEIYRDNFPRTQFRNSKPTIALSLPLIIHDNHEAAIRLSDSIFTSYLNVWTDAAKAWSNRVSTDYPKYTGLAQILRNNNPTLMRDRLQALVGCPNAIADGINILQDSLNIDYILFQLDTGSQPGTIAKNSLMLFMEKVLPQLKENIPCPA